MSSKDIGEAQRKAAERKKMLKQPVLIRPDAPDNIKLSKAEFIAKRRAEKEEDVKVAEYRKKLRSEKAQPKEAEDGVQGKKEEGKEVVRKKGGPKKVTE